MKGTLKVHTAIFFIQYLEPQLAPIYLFRFFFSALAVFVPPPVKGQLCYLSLLGGYLLLTLSWNRVF